MQDSLRAGIQRNRQFQKYVAMLHRLRLRVFDYQDLGLTDKAERIADRIKGICEPTLKLRRRRLARNGAVRDLEI